MATTASTTATVTATALDARALAVAENTPEMLAEHARVTQGKVRTRFPPEPNGYLHIGHAKSMHMNFCEAFDKLGVPEAQREVIFRYDDTNPEAESQEYIHAIRATIDWLGYTPSQVTYSSEYFEELYELALRLIRRGAAYVCHQSKPEIEASRTALQSFHGTASATPRTEADVPAKAQSPYRSRSVEENLREFEKMRLGLYAEGEACLRMKQDLASPNPNMWDHVAYRIKYVAHPHIGDKWCIYPTYDYTHCIVDALEHIDYSICTLEFETRRESYYWLLDVLGLYKPKVYEFARLEMTYTQLSKRKLLKLVTSGMVRGWDDPRLATLNGLKRRGLTPEIIKRFCKEIGVTRVQSTIQIERLYSVARDVLGDASKRVMAVLDPVEVVLENYHEGELHHAEALTCKVMDYPQDVARENGAHHFVTLTDRVFVDRSDMRSGATGDDASDFYGITVGKVVRLKYAFNFTCTRMEMDPVDASRITRVYGQVDWSNAVKPKGILTWVPCLKSQAMEVRVYSHLFKVPEIPGDADWESLLDLTHSEVVYPHARMDSESYARLFPTGTTEVPAPVQFERVGYFALDQADSSAGKTVWNQIVPLRESAAAAALEGSTASEGGAASASRKDAQAQQLALKKERMKIPASEYFKQTQSELFSAFGSDGLPTHDAKGEALTKTMLKKLKKEQDKHKKLHDAYLKEQAK